MKQTLTQKLGLLGVLSFFSYAAAVVLAPLAYPGYDWMAQAFGVVERFSVFAATGFNAALGVHLFCGKEEAV